MARKLNRKAAEAYSEYFSSKVLDNFFSDRLAATGQDILELTPVQQVNLLIVQRFYQRWQEEALRLRSPYFNYDHPQVQESLQSFMNTLSRHILVERAALEPLLQAAVLDTLRLLFNPMAFFDEFLRLYTNSKTLQASLRYLRMQQSLTDVLHEQVEQKETYEPEYLLAMLDAGIRSGNLELEPVDEHMQAFNEVLAVPEDMVEEPVVEAPAAAAAPPKEEPADFFSAISQLAPRTPRPANRPKETPKPVEAESSRREPVEPAPAPQPKHIERVTVPTVEIPETAEPEPTPAPFIKLEMGTPAEPAAAPAAASAPPIDTTVSQKKQEEESRNLNTRFEQRNEKKPLYEKFETKEPRSATITNKQRSANIRHYITLNQRFMFVKELFGGDGGAFNASLDALDSCQSLGEAQQWVQQHLAPKPQWQPDSDVVLEFENVLHNRFGG